MQVSVPKNIGLRYKTLNFQDNCLKSDNASEINYVWNIKNVKAKKIDNNAGPSYLHLPIIILAPNQFRMDEYNGDMRTWKGLGKWYENLISTTNTLSPQEQAFYQNLVSGKTTGMEKAETIYHYLQNNMRYVSIQLGIGGWKPFAASFVNIKKYGDCKALVNYMQAALSAVGIKSYPVINHSGELTLPIEKDFTINAFNHVLLCIPQQKDSIWVECTSTVSGVVCSFGELYAETKDHPALLVTENGGELVRTPEDKAEDNTRSVKTVIDMDKDGSAIAHSTINVKGEMKFISYSYLYNASEEGKRSYIFDMMKFKQADSLQVSLGDKFQNPFQYNLKLNYSQLPDFTSGTKVFIPSRLYEIFREYLPEDTARKQDYYFDYPYQKTDTTILHYPAGYKVEDMPTNKVLETPYTSYASIYISDIAAHIITVITKFSVNKKVASASDYNKLSKFAAKVLDDLDEKIVLIKEDE
ncbi:MAG: transglutaminase domain-containing protein [Arachidicoccus sp.]|nr:transglutaminase domain-containing protein [Arachidicoccus sp.]